MTNETLPADIATAALEPFRAMGARISPVRGDGSRFASFDIELPNGQMFRIKIEEM